MLESMKADKKVLIMGGMVLGIIAIFVCHCTSTGEQTKNRYVTGRLLRTSRIT